MEDDSWKAFEPLNTDMGTLYFKDSFFRPVKEKKEIQYGKSHLQIARRFDGSVFAIDLTEAFRASFVGATRSGKSFFFRGIADRLVQIGKSVAFMGDIKGEYFSSYKPVQAHFRDKLFEGETPQGMKVVALRPTFFRTVQKELPKRNFWYSVNFKELSKADFMSLLNSHELTQNQRVSLEIIWQRLEKYLKQNPEEKFSIPLINAVIESVEELSVTQKNALKFKFMPLEHAKFFVPRYERDIAGLISQGYVPTFNYEYFDRFGKGGGFDFPTVTLNIVLRELINARMKKLIPPLYIFFDEAGRFIGNRTENSLKESILEAVDVTARYGVNFLIASQNLDDIPENILKQSKYTFVPATADVHNIRYALMSTGLVKNQQIAYNSANRIKKTLMKVKHSWLVLNRMDGTMDFIKPAAPLSWHLETSD